MHNKALHMTSFILVIIGGINWGLIGLLKFDLVDTVLGFSDALVRVVYVLVGLAAVYLLATHKHDCKTCGNKDHQSGDAPTPPPINN